MIKASHKFALTGGTLVSDLARVWTSSESRAVAIRAMSKTDLESAGNEASQSVIQRYSWRKVFDRMFETYQKIRA